jgi:hypothetical protein
MNLFGPTFSDSSFYQKWRENSTGAILAFVNNPPNKNTPHTIISAIKKDQKYNDLDPDHS